MRLPVIDARWVTLAVLGVGLASGCSSMSGAGEDQNVARGAGGTDTSGGGGGMQPAGGGPPSGGVGASNGSGGSGGASCEISPSERALCVFDYDLTLSSHDCPEAAGDPSCRENACATYSWFDQCLAPGARDAIARCVENGAYIGIASHADVDDCWNDKVLPAVVEQQFPEWFESPHYGAIDAEFAYPPLDERSNWNCSDCAYHMNPGIDKAEGIGRIMLHYGLDPKSSADRARVLFWDDSPSNIETVEERMPEVHAILVPRVGADEGGCGIGTAEIELGWQLAPIPACSSSQTPSVDVECPVVSEPAVQGTVEAEPLVEISGIAASRTRPGVFWVHNDSGDGPRLYGLNAAGQLVAILELSGVDASDWEDIAIGGDRGNHHYLYVGDIGDNAEARSSITIHRVPEPELDSTTPPALQELIATPESFHLTYPDQPRDAEALLLDPWSGDLYVVTKSPQGTSEIHRASAPFAASDTLEHVGTLTLGTPAFPGDVQITGGDISSNGHFIALRTYSHAFLWTRDTGASLAEALAQPPCASVAIDEPQGEAIGFSAAGNGFVTLSEQGDQPLLRFGFE